MPDEKEAKKQKEKKAQYVGAGAWGALNIADHRASVALVMSTAGASTEGKDGPAGDLDVERIKSAMQWDLWNPWATWFELHSTHPLTAKRLHALGDQASSMGQKPMVAFDRKKPESYWGHFFADVLVLMLPYFGVIAGLAAAAGLAVTTGTLQLSWLLLPVVLLGVGMLVRTLFAYRGRIFEHLSVAALLGHVKVSPVRPVPATVTGKVIGKGEPGLVFSEDFVMRDDTGILFLDYNQPLAVWNFLFGLLRAGRYQGKQVRVTGWFRRQPVPYFEVYKMEVVDGSEPSRTCFAYHAAIGFAAGVAVAGVLGMALTWGVQLF